MTTPHDLPPLPVENYIDKDGLWDEKYGPYDAEQMREYALAAIAPYKAEIERLVRVHDNSLRLLREAKWERDKLRELLREVAAQFTRDDGLADRLLPRIDDALKDQP